jgi:hypothetical protein
MKQEISPEILRCCVVVSFNWDDAQHAAKLDWKRQRAAGIERDAMKDDVKIIVQAIGADAEFVITDDAETFFKYCHGFKQAGDVRFKTIKLEDGFDRAFFDRNGQRDLIDPEEPEPPTA